MTTLKSYLDAITSKYERVSFIDGDPVSIPRAFDSAQDQEIIGLFAAVLAWGRRDVMLSKLGDLCERMGFRPYEFVSGYSPDRAGDPLSGFGHRTFLPADAVSLVRGIQSILDEYGSIAALCESHITQNDQHIGPAIEALSSTLLRSPEEMPVRMRKHLPRPSAGSACKRLCMFFRWMVRGGPVDLGIWKFIKPDQLIVPLDVHSGRQARAIGILKRKSNDWRAALELTAACRLLDPHDPVRYDFALFGTGIAGETLSWPANQSLPRSSPCTCS